MTKQEFEMSVEPDGVADGTDREKFLSTLFDDMPSGYVIAVQTSKFRFMSVPESDVAAANRRIQRMLRDGREHNIYVGVHPTSQTEKRVSKTGNPYVVAVRKAAFITHGRALFADVDIGKADQAKSMKDVGEFAQTLAAAVKAKKVPHPTMIVRTGGGFHLYWVLDKWLPAGEWKTLATAFESRLLSVGLRMDPVGKDIARVLRPPGTWHTKDGSVPKPVELIHHSGVRLVTDAVRRMVGVGAAGPSARVPSVSSAPVANRDSAVGAMLAKAKALTAPGVAPGAAQGEFSGGVSMGGRAQPTPFDVVLKNCATLADVHARSGAGDSEPMWNLAVYAAACYGEEGRKLAHAMSDGHADYERADTDKKFDIKLSVAATDAAGWPTCDSFAQHSDLCATCRFRPHIKSPLGVGKVDLDSLPPGYIRRKDGPPGGEVTTIWRAASDDAPAVRLLSCDLTDPRLEWSPEGPVLSVAVVKQHCEPERLLMPANAINTWRDKAMTLLAQVGIAVRRQSSHMTQEFFVAFLQLLQQRMAPQMAVSAFGWHGKAADPDGFTVAGTMYTKNGGSRAVMVPDRFMTELYSPTGDLDLWRESAMFLVNQGRPDIAAMMAVGFAAPLVAFTGESGLIVSAWSAQSGRQKSAAANAAQSVWGHPRRAGLQGASTANGVLHRMGLLKNLPVVWDEVKYADLESRFVDIVFTAAQGVEKARLTADIQQQRQGSWSTMMLISTNFSVQTVVAQASQNQAAAANRVFEFEIAPMPPSARVPLAESTAMLSRLADNYGVAGREYAAWLAQNSSTARKVVQHAITHFEGLCKPSPEERFWLLTAAVLYAGALMAKGRGLVDFDIPALESFLVDTFAKQRYSKEDGTPDADSQDFAVHVLFRYINHCRHRNMCLETDIMTTGRGSLKVRPESRLLPSAREHLRAPVVHIAQDMGMLRIVPKDFINWLNVQEKIPVKTVLQALERQAGMTRVRNTWCGGTEWAGAQIPLFQIVYKGTPFGAQFAGTVVSKAGD